MVAKNFSNAQRVRKFAKEIIISNPVIHFYPPPLILKYLSSCKFDGCNGIEDSSPWHSSLSVSSQPDQLSGESWDGDAFKLELFPKWGLEMSDLRMYLPAVGVPQK